MQKLFVQEYHNWLDKQREKDKKYIGNKALSLATYYLRQGLCPYCKRKFKVVEQEGILARECKRHGLLGIKKKNWKIWKKQGDKK